MFKEIGELKSCSTVTLMQHQDGFVVAVSILGEFLGAVDVDAQMDDFPNEGNHRQGHVVFLDRENGIETMSFTMLYVLLEKDTVFNHKTANKAFKSDSQRLAVSLRSSIAKRRSHLNAALCIKVRHLHLAL